MSTTHTLVNVMTPTTRAKFANVPTWWDGNRFERGKWIGCSFCMLDSDYLAEWHVETCGLEVPIDVVKFYAESELNPCLKSQVFGDKLFEDAVKLGKEEIDFEPCAVTWDREPGCVCWLKTSSGLIAVAGDKFDWVRSWCEVSKAYVSDNPLGAIVLMAWGAPIGLLMPFDQKRLKVPEVQP